MARVEENKDKPVRCSFCGKLQSEVGTLIAGPGVYICDECIDICQSIINEEPDAKRKKGNEADFASLGVDRKTAAEDACKIEHVISDDTFSALKQHFGQKK